MTTTPPDPTSERDRAIHALQQVGLLRPVSAEKLKTFVPYVPLWSIPFNACHKIHPTGVIIVTHATGISAKQNSQGVQF